MTWSSWKAESQKFKNFRRGKTDPEVPLRDGRRKKKDTKAWCRGKVGREHTVKLIFNNTHFYRIRCEPTSWMEDKWWCCHQYKCTVCGKVIREYLGKDCPDYRPPT